MQVTKKEVDKFELGKRIPACQLQAVAQQSQHHMVTASDLIHPLKLLGTKTLRDYIILFRSPVSTQGTIIFVPIVYSHCTYRGCKGGHLSPEFVNLSVIKPQSLYCLLVMVMHVYNCCDCQSQRPVYIIILLSVGIP